MVPATFAVGAGEASTLIADIATANGNGDASNIIQLSAGSTYSLTSVNNYWFGPDGLPAIACNLLIQGNGASIIRAAESPDFRIFCVLGGPTFGSAAAGSLTLQDLTLSGGVARGGNSYGGGGGLGAGGAIFNVGRLNLFDVTLAQDEAIGGSTGSTGSSNTNDGGGIGQGSFANPTGSSLGEVSATSNAGGFGGSFPGAQGGTAGAAGGSGAGGGGGFSSNGQTGGSTGGTGGGLSVLGGAAGPGNNPSNSGEGGGGSTGNSLLVGPGGNFGLGAPSGLVTSFIANSPSTKPMTTNESVGGGGGGVGGGGANSGYLSTSKETNGGGGGFGGGGGAGPGNGGGSGGEGGFGGGGGAGQDGAAGSSVFGGGRGGTGHGSNSGGGAGMGGAVFNLFGTVKVVNCTMAGDLAFGGGGGDLQSPGQDGAGLGGCVFNLNGFVTILQSTLSGTVGYLTGSGAGNDQLGAAIYNLALGSTPSGAEATADLILGDDILASSGGTDSVVVSVADGFPSGIETRSAASVVAVGPNLVQNSPLIVRISLQGISTGPSAGTPFTIGSPDLGPLQNNGGSVETMAPAGGSMALGAGKPGVISQYGDANLGATILDGYMGQVYINTVPFDGQSQPTTFSFSAPASSVGHEITPLVFSVSGGVSTLAAVYQPILVNQSGLDSSSLTPLTGGLVPGTNYVFGYTDQLITLNGGNLDTVSITAGTIPYEDVTNGTWVDTQTGATQSVPLSLGETFSTVPGNGAIQLETGRVYSASITLSGPAFAYDQRGLGYSRVVDGSIDLGAYQTQADSTLAVGDPSPGQTSRVRVYNAVTGGLKFEIEPFAHFRGEIRTAVGDVNGDGIPDIIVAEGPGGSPLVRVYNGNTGTLLRSFLAFGARFRGGVYVAAGDLTGSGRVDIIAGAGPGGGSQVRVFDGRDGSLLRSFSAYAPGFNGGVTVAAGDLTGRGFADIITGMASGGSKVKAFSGADGSLLAHFTAMNGKASGIYVAAGNLNRTGQADVIVGAGAGSRPVIRVYSGTSGKLLQKFLAYPSRFQGGVRVGTSDLDGNGNVAILAAPGTGMRPEVRVYNGKTDALMKSILAFKKTDRNGLYISSTPSARFHRVSAGPVVDFMRSKQHPSHLSRFSRAVNSLGM